MSREIGIEQARKALGDLANEVRYSGNDIILTRNGKPVARIAPLARGPHDMSQPTEHRGVIEAQEILREAGHPLAHPSDVRATGYYIHALSSGDMVAISYLDDGKEIPNGIGSPNRTPLGDAARLFLGKMKWGSIPSPYTHLTLIPRWSSSMSLDRSRG